MSDGINMADSEAVRSFSNRQDTDIDYTPRVGLEFDSEREAYEFYRIYGWKLGFNVRREYANKSRKTGEITSRKFTCSKEGFRAPDKRSTHTKNPQPETRTGCLAHMVIRRKKENGKYEIYGFESLHNHPLFIESCANPSQRKMPSAQSSEADQSNDSGTIPKNANEPESRHDGVRDNLSYNRQVQNCHLRTKRQRDMKYGETGILLNCFQDQSLENPLFYYAVQLDVEERISNIFWADAKMIIDYSHFGDVISFDVIFRNNKGFRPFASFVGFNHHGETVLFGAALLYDETFESFQWLFETFLHAMSGKKPKTIFTDQDGIIANAISLVMPEAYHGICIWRLKENAMKHLNHLFRGDCDFKQEFKACINDYEEDMEFLTAWDAMINKHNLRDNIWLQKLFEEKDKWAKPYVKWAFSAGMRSTQLNESLHSDLRDFLKSDIDLILFLRHFEKVVNDRRYKELEVEYNSRLKLPYFKIKAPMLTQAADVYTNMIFQLFQEEYEEFQSAYILHRDETGPCREYMVAVLGKNSQYKVFGNPSEQTVSCSCRKFETHGFLCSHAVKILDTMDIKYIPDRYIMKRWTKNARDPTLQDLQGRIIQADTTSEVSSRYKYLCPKYVRLVARASECEEAFRLLDQYSVELSKKVKEILQKQTSIDASLTDTDVDISLSATSQSNEAERNLDSANSIRGKGFKKKGQKGKFHLRSCIEKGLQEKKKCCPEQPPMPYSLSDASTPSGNVLLQGLEMAPNMSSIGSQTPPAYKTYKGIDLSNPSGPTNCEGIHSSPHSSFTPILRESLASFQTSQASNCTQYIQCYCRNNSDELGS
ncbi:protein FAR1-RELATED SEQUENCE 5-like isoform X1 [Typha angustifolia]|uniref:protein FAR1-RELATED SEQUENCE 5-like isoform X1 n=1 Tax=Typha angustifolia TaxID=59011 RepID=UPI003C2C9751